MSPEEFERLPKWAQKRLLEEEEMGELQSGATPTEIVGGLLVLLCRLGFWLVIIGALLGGFIYFVRWMFP